MGLFDFLRRKKTPPAPANPLTSDALRDAIFDAHARQDQRGMEKLFASYGAQITQQCLDWTLMPEPLRSNRDSANRYVNALMWLAQVLQQSGDGRLMNKLVRNDEDNPMTRWDQTLQKSRDAATAMEYDNAIRLLEDILIDTRQMSGPGMEHYVPVTHGTLGAHCFHCGKIELAGGHFEKALELCEQYGDAEGVRAYCGSLYEVQRYLGNPVRAADYAERSAQGEPDQHQAGWIRHQASLLRDGSMPLLRVVAAVDEKRYEIADAPPVRDTTVQFLFERNRPQLNLCTALTQRGSKLGSAGKYDEALAEFHAAAAVDPHAPGCRYNEAFTLMCLQRYSDAADLYAKVEALAPGWFNTRADGWLAAQMAAGRWPHPVFMALMFEDSSPPQLPWAEKLEFVNKALSLAPDYARLHLLRGRTLEAMGGSNEAAEAYRTGLACAGEDDTRSRLLLHLHTASAAGKDPDLLRQAAQLASSGNLMAAAMAEFALRSAAA